MKIIAQLSLFLLIIYSISLLSQTKNSSLDMNNMPIGEISGYLRDAQTGQPIEYGNIVLLRYSDSSLVNGTVSGKEGNFTLSNLPFGIYLLRASFIGYSSRIIDSIKINPRSLKVELGEIKLDESSIELGNVIVTGEKQMIINNLDKKVINVEKDLATVGGSAVDVVQNIPSVSVDADGNVSFRGNKNLTILIDGKPSELLGMGSGDILSNIPASSIESVELVTNPSARYDPEGTAGIINIVLKKKINSGINGSLALTGGTGSKYNASVNFNYKIPMFNFFSSFDSRLGKLENYGSSLRSNFFNSSLALLNTNSTGIFESFSNNLSAGLDFLPDNFNTLSFNFRYRKFGFDNNGTVQNKSYNLLNSLTNYFERSTDADRRINSFNYTLSYRRTFQKQSEELTADIILGVNRMNRDENIIQKNFNSDLTPKDEPLNLQNGLSNNKNQQWTIQANYINPIESFGRIETGFKVSLRNFNSKNDYLSFDYISNSWIYDLLRKTDFDYKEKIYAAYGIYSNNIDQFQYQLGIRVEQANVEGSENLSAISFNNNYFNIYPTVHLVQSLPNQQELQLSYSRRVERPGNRQLNPYIDRSDSLNISYGNPELRPEFINSLELGYSKIFDKTAITSSLFYKNTSDAINSFTILRDDGVTESTWRNIAASISYGIEITAAHPLFDWLRLNGSFTYLANEFVYNDVKRKDFTWQGKLNGIVAPSKDFNLQVNFNYNAPQIIPQGKIKQVYSTDVALKKDFMEGQLSLTFRVSDIFNTRNFESETIDQNFITSSYRKMESRTAYLGFTFRLQQGNNNRERKPRSDEGMDDF